MKCKRKGLVQPLSEIEGFPAFLDYLIRKRKGKVLGTVDACKGHLVYSVATYLGKCPVILTEDDVSAKKLYEDLQFFYDDKEVYLYPARVILFYNADLHSMDITADRMKIIDAMLIK